MVEMDSAPVYETRPKIGLMAVLFFLGFLIIGCVLSIPIIIDRSAYYIFFVYYPLLIPGSMLLFCQIPRIYIVLSDRFEIRTLVWTWKLPYKTIRSVSSCAAGTVFKSASWKPMLAFSECVWIERVNGIPFLISPLHREEFLKHAQKALEEWKSTSGEKKAFDRGEIKESA